MSPAAPHASIRVLIVDDDPLVRRLLHAVLTAGEFELLEAEDGREALRLADDRVPDVVILDVMMPGLSGIEVCSMLRADARFDATKIVLLTARASEGDREEGLRAGADEYFTKPFSPLDLIASVTDVKDSVA